MLRCSKITLFSRSSTSDTLAKSFLLNHSIWKNPSPSNATSAVPLVVIHGLLGSHTNLRHFSQLLKAKEVIALDLRNHGKSPQSQEMSFTLMQNDVIHTLNHLGIPKCDILGHSLGGKVAMGVSIEYPDKIRKQVILDMAPVKYNLDMDKPTTREGYSTGEIISILNSLPLFYSKEECENLLREKMPNMSKGMLSFLLMGLREDSSAPAMNGKYPLQFPYNIRAVHQNFDKYLISWDYPNVKCKTPTLFLRGERSKFVPEYAIESSIRPNFLNHQLEVIRDAGHWIHSEQPDEVAKRVNRFLYE